MPSKTKKNKKRQARMTEAIKSRLSSLHQPKYLMAGIVLLLMAISSLSSGVFPKIGTRAASIIFTQTDWSGGDIASSSTAQASGWDKYDSSLDIIDTNTGQVSLAPTVHWPWGDTAKNLSQNVFAQKNAKMATVTNNDVALVVWQDGRSGNEDIYGVLIDLNGGLAILPVTVICNDPADQINPKVVYDGSNGYFIVAWEDFRSGIKEVYMQALDATSLFEALGSNGVAVPDDSPGYAMNDFDMAVSYASGLSTGEILFSWWEDRNDTSGNCNWGTEEAVIESQKVAYSGGISPGWTTTNTELCYHKDVQNAPLRVLSNGNGDAYIVWDNKQGGVAYSDIYAGWVGFGVVFSGYNGASISNGSYPGISLSNFSAHTYPEQGISSIYISWEADNVGTGKDTYLQCFDPLSSSCGSPVAGLSLTNASGDQKNSQIVYDYNNSNIFVVWEDGVDGGIYAQKIDSSSYSPYWSVGGKKISTMATINNNPLVVFNPNVSGGTMMAWNDSDGKIYFSEVDPNGNVVSSGNVEGEITNGQTNMVLRGGAYFQDNINGANTNNLVILWEDDGLAANQEVYLQESFVPDSADLGYITSSYFYYTADVDWDSIDITVNNPSGAGVSLQTRTSSNGVLWSPWSSEDFLANTSGSELLSSNITSPDGKYIQYKVNFTKGNTTPVLEEVSILGTPIIFPSASLPPTYSPEEDVEVVEPPVIEPPPPVIEEPSVPIEEEIPKFCGQTFEQFQASPIPQFPEKCGLGWSGTRVDWAIEHRANIYNLYTSLLGRGGCSVEIDWWFERYCDINNIRRGILNSEEYKSKHGL